MRFFIALVSCLAVSACAGVTSRDQPQKTSPAVRSCGFCQVLYFNAPTPESDGALAKSEPAGASSYTYKRVIMPLLLRSEDFGPIAFPERAQRSAVPPPYRCQVIDYYKSGQRALLLTAASASKTCLTVDGRPTYIFNGEAIYYYPSGQVSEKAAYKMGNLQGELVDYNEDGTVRDRHFYENGKLADNRQ